MSAAGIAIARKQYPSITSDDYVILGPDGTVLKITKDVYRALAMLTGEGRIHEAGQIQLDCNRGSVAAVTVNNLKLK